MMEKPKPEEKILSTTPIICWCVGMLIGLSFGLMMDMGSQAQTFMKMMFLATMGSFLSFFLQFTYQPGHIFGWWIPLVEKHFRDNPKNPFGYLANPLGICAFCQNIWLTSIIFIAAHFLIGISFWWFIPATLTSHMILTLLAKLFWEE